MTKKESDRILNDLFEVGKRYLLEDIYEMIHKKYEYSIDVLSTDNKLNDFHVKMHVDDDDGEVIIGDEWCPCSITYLGDGIFISEAQNKFIFYLTSKHDV